MRGIGSLPSTSAEIASLLTALKEGIQQSAFQTSLQQTVPKFREDRIMKSTLIEGKRECVFPVDPCTNRFSSLSITQIFCKLHHADESQTPGRNRGLPDFRVDTCKQFIIIDGAQFVTHLHVDIS